MKIRSMDDYQSLRQKLLEEQPLDIKKILVCCGTGCRAGGSLEIAADLEKTLQEQGLTIELELVVKTPGCQGMCEKGPLVWLMPQGIFYCRVSRSDIEEIVSKTVKNGEIIERLLYRDPESKQPAKTYQQIAFINKQKRLVLQNMGVIDPGDIRDYIRVGGYQSLIEALNKWQPDQIVDAIDKSGLRGRGGGGFHTGRKWRSCKSCPLPRYVICNGDEGDPGAFMDRSIMEGDPHSVLEGMIIGAYAIGAEKGYIYVRHEYPLAVQHLTQAIAQAREYGFLGANILGSGFNFDITINRGGGAFVCGESSALMRSLEGKIGEPRAKYIHSTERGLFEKPTVLNNVETWTNVPLVIKNGPEWFSQIGVAKSTGTKVFSLVGKVKNTGLIEVEMGTTLRQIIYDIGGGIINDRPFKAVQTGGPSGGCLPAAALDYPVDFDTLTEAGSMMGSGGMIVMDDLTCMVDVAKYFTKFLIQESCGKCLPCREGLPQLYRLLEDITIGCATIDHIERIENLAMAIQYGSLCGLGTTAANPVLSTLRYFKDEYLEHINNKRCPGGVCSALIRFDINAKCTGCGACLRICPVNAIHGEKKQKHEIDQALCSRCGSCYQVCKFDAITIGSRT